MCSNHPHQQWRCFKRARRFAGILSSARFQRQPRGPLTVGSWILRKWHLTKWQKTAVMSRCCASSPRFTFTGSRRERLTVDIGKIISATSEVWGRSLTSVGQLANRTQRSIIGHPVVRLDYNFVQTLCRRFQPIKTVIITDYSTCT